MCVRVCVCVCVCAQAKLDELYAWGNRHGWEPVMLDRQGKPIPPTTTP